MLSSEDFIRMSLNNNLMFLRIMKEHAFFLAASFTPQNPNYLQTAEVLSGQFGMLLREAVQLANSVLSPEAVSAGQFFTQYTLDAERVTQYYSGLPIDSTITQQELNLQPGNTAGRMPGLENRVADLNNRILSALDSLIAFKTNLLSNVLSCRIFTYSYPLLIDHILREAKFYRTLLMRLQNRSNIRTDQDLIEQEIFWNRIMAEHAKFIRGLLDPTEEQLFETANLFGRQFDALTQESMHAQNNAALLPQVTADSLEATRRISEFKAAATGGLLQCKIRSIIVPLLGDHVLREANHFIFIMKRGDAPIRAGARWA